MCGSFENATFVELKKSDVVVLTPQILLNELKVFIVEEKYFLFHVCVDVE